MVFFHKPNIGHSNNYGPNGPNTNSYVNFLSSPILVRRWSEKYAAEGSKYAHWIGLYLSFHLNWVLGPSVHGRLQNLQTSEVTFAHVITPLIFLIKLKIYWHKFSFIWNRKWQYKNVCTLHFVIWPKYHRHIILQTGYNRQQQTPSRNPYINSHGPPNYTVSPNVSSPSCPLGAGYAGHALLYMW